jgi:hypothetical protein
MVSACPNVCFGSRLFKNADIEVAGVAGFPGSQSYAWIALIKPPAPRMLITLFMLQARTCSAISVPTFLSVFIRKCVAPVQDFIVPKGRSTVWRRSRILAGFRSSRACTTSRTDSCSHRSLPVVHLLFSVQLWQAAVLVERRY